jgi:hypothetical protein
MVLSRAVNVPCSPGQIAVKPSSGMAEAGGTGRFCVQELWQFQNILDVCRVLSAVLCGEILVFQVPRWEKKGK